MDRIIINFGRLGGKSYIKQLLNYYYKVKLTMDFFYDHTRIEVNREYRLMEFLEKIAESVKHGRHRRERRDIVIMESYSNICKECQGLLKSSFYWHVYPKKRCKCSEAAKPVPRNPKPTKTT